MKEDQSSGNRMNMIRKRKIAYPEEHDQRGRIEET
jgi:hypothetical protein